MPGFDGTGPLGQGPMTGRGLGFCVLKETQLNPEQIEGFAGINGRYIKEDGKRKFPRKEVFGMPRGDGTGSAGQGPGTGRNRGLSQSQDRDRMGEQEEEILSEIAELMNEKKDPASVQDKGALSAKLKNLVALGAAIASKQEPEVINVCIENCIKSGATRQNVMAVLQKAILMAQMPVENYTKTVNDAIDAFVD